MSEFGDAFAAARKAGKKTFTFGGKLYTTKTKEETATKAGPTPSQRPKARPEAPAAAGSQRPKARPTSANQSGSPDDRSSKPAPKANTERIAAAKTDVAARRAKSQAANRPTKDDKTAPKPAAGKGRNVLKIVGDFFAGGGLAGKRARDRAAAAAAAKK